MVITLVKVVAKNTYDGKLVNRLSTVGVYSLIACLEGAGIEFGNQVLTRVKGGTVEQRLDPAYVAPAVCRH